jgi:hypothetical protein
MYISNQPSPSNESKEISNLVGVVLVVALNIAQLELAGRYHT